MTTQQGKNLLTFAIFALISALFWFLMTLNDNVERDYRVPVNITDIPEDVNFVVAPPEYISVNVKGKGSDMFRYDLLGAPTLNVRFSQLETVGPNTSELSASALRPMVRKMFSGDDYLLTISPDSLRISYTTAPGRRIAVKAVSDVTASANHIVYGTPTVTPDSVTIYSVKELPVSLKYVVTEEITAVGLRDSLQITAALETPPGTRLEPAEVKVIIPVEPLVSRTRTVRIEPTGVPDGYKLSTFPATVKLSVMVPMSLYAGDDTPVKVYADYSRRSGNTIPLKLSILPEYYRNPTLAAKRVEFILEKEQ